MSCKKASTSLLGARATGRWLLVSALIVAVQQGVVSAPSEDEQVDGGALVRGMTISCQTNGREWATDGFGDELDRLRELGINWVAIHPYARIHADGEVSWRAFDRENPPRHVVRPIEQARARGMSILVTPHLAYWGGPFRYRGEIGFETPEQWERFFTSYGEWITRLAEVAADADAFCIGSELDRTIGRETEWRKIAASVRAVTNAHLTYAANWDAFEQVVFWDALDAIGVQAYFPLSERDEPSAEELQAGWQPVIARLRRLHESTGKPVIFTELGYNCSLNAAREPWDYRQAPAAERERAGALQERCMRAALVAMEPQAAWLRGAFLWKWFVGPAPRENFMVDTPELRALLRERWGVASSPDAGRGR